jgi:hypothetical protein
MLAIKGIYDGVSIKLIDMPGERKPCKVIVTFLDEYESEEEVVREYFTQTDGMDFWKCEEEDLYKDFIFQ